MRDGTVAEGRSIVVRGKHSISVCLEIGPEATGAFVPDCPGCWVFGSTKERAMVKVRMVVLEWAEWLRSNGEVPPFMKRDVEIEGAEMLRVDYNPAEARKPEPLFWSEVAPIAREDIDRTIRLMEYSRNDLMAAVAGITDDCLDWEPPGEPRTIRNCLAHIAHVELWYLTRISVVPWPVRLPETTLELLEHSRDVALAGLRGFPERKMKGVFQPRKYRSPVCNLWTARKVLRRLVDHERLHMRYVKRVLELCTRVASSPG